VKDIGDQVKGFLREQGMWHEDIDMERSCGIFLEEMEKGLGGEGSSLAMLPTYIETDREVPSNEPVIVMDAGGTNFRVASVCFDESGRACIENFKVHPMPGVKEEVSKERFFEIMAGYVAEVIGTSERVGFCFSYPIEMLASKDGRLLRFSKEIKAKEVEGQMIGENFKLAMEASGHGKGKRVVLLNDTVATLLAGLSQAGKRAFDGHIGFILGTGTNCSYVEENRNITKAKDLEPTKSQIVNTESGGFGKASRGSIDHEFDASTMNPGVNVFEKMISGAYLGMLCLRTAQKAAKAGLFSGVTAEKLLATERFESKDISDFMYNPKGGNVPARTCKGGGESNIAALACLVDALVERAAKLTAINLSSVVLKSQKGRDATHPICIVAEGTTFYELKSLKERVESYLKSYLEGQKQRYYEIVRIEDATLVGAAIAGLTN